MNMLFQTDWPIFVVTLLSVLVAISSASITYMVYRSQVSPEVIVYVEPDLDAREIFVLVIENIGKGVARSIRFELSEAIPSGAWGNESKAEQMKSGPLFQVIPMLAPGAKRRIFWGQFHGLQNALAGKSITITAWYKGNTDFLNWLEGNHHLTTDSVLEIESFMNEPIGDNSNLGKCATSLEAIADGIKKVLDRS